MTTKRIPLEITIFQASNHELWEALKQIDGVTKYHNKWENREFLVAACMRSGIEKVYAVPSSEWSC